MANGIWADKYTLFKEGLIPNTTDDAYEHFMLQQEKDNKSPIYIVCQIT
jgi:hypothetical protein